MSLFLAVKTKGDQARMLNHIGRNLIRQKKYQAIKRGKKVEFTPLEFQILHLLIQKKDKVPTRDDFLNEIWGEDNLVVSYRTIDSHMANIRKKIEDNPSDPKYIISIRGVGYKLSE